MDRRLRRRDDSGVVDGAQRVDFPIHFRHQAIGVRDFRGAQKFGEESLGHMGHVARDNDVPVGGGDAKRGVETAERSAIFDFIGDDRQTEVRVFMNLAYESHISGCAADGGGDLFDHGRTPKRQQGLIAAHAPAGSACQNKACLSNPRHEMILATSAGVCVKEQRRIVESNKRVYICLLVAFAMLAASPSRAADPIPAPVVHKTQVVRADPRTGKLVRSIVVSSRPAITKITPPASGSSINLNAIVDQASRAHDVDPLLVHSIIKQESNYNVHAVSNKGAQGLMQLTPSTARMLGVSNSFDPQQNIEAGVKYLKYLQDLYKDDRLALAAYNAGPGAVDKYKWIPPYAETQNYVYQVGKRYGEARRAADAAKPAAVPVVDEVKAVEAKPVEPAKVEPFIDENGRLHLKTAQ